MLTLVFLAALARPPQGVSLEDLIGLNKFEEALAVCAESEKLAIKAKDADGVAAIREKRAAITSLKKEYEKIKDFDVKLAADPEDPVAADAIGRFSCFVKDDWVRGLPLLAKGADPFLKALADMEITKSSRGEDKVAIGDGWWTGSAEVDTKLGLTGAVGTVKVAVDRDTARKVRLKMMARAVYWYQQSWPQLQDADRDKLRPKFKALYSNPNAGPDRIGAETGWSAVDTGMKFGPSQAYAHGGRSALTVLGDPKIKNGTLTNNVTVRLIPGKEYELSCWYLSSAVDSGGALTMYANDANGKLFQPVAGMEPDTPFWKRASCRFIVPDGIGTIHVRLLTGPKKGQLWIDDVSLKCEGAELLKNGSFEGK